MINDIEAAEHMSPSWESSSGLGANLSSMNTTIHGHTGAS
jgi:hypothetical protein